MPTGTSSTVGRTEMPHAGALEALHQLGGVGERGKVAALHLVRCDDQPFPDHAPHERRRKEAVPAAEQELRGHVGPGGRGAGVLVSARRTLDIAHAWGGRHPMGVLVVVVTHSAPEDWVNRAGSPFTFVTDGVPSAIARAQEIAGNKDVVVGAPSVTRQCLKLGLLDEIHIDLVPLLLGRGVRLFDQIAAPIELLVTVASGNSHVTHLTYRVVK